MRIPPKVHKNSVDRAIDLCNEYMERYISKVVFLDENEEPFFEVVVDRTLLPGDHVSVSYEFNQIAMGQTSDVGDNRPTGDVTGIEVTRDGRLLVQHETRWW